MATSLNINRRLVESIRDEPRKNLTPILGYEKENVKTLEEACTPLRGILDDKLNQYMTLVQMNSTKPEDNLSPDEAAAICLYTVEWDVHEKSLYMILNQSLRQGDRIKLRPWFKYLKLLLTAFFKLPLSKETLVWRGVREDLSVSYPKDKKFAWWTFSSCSASISVLESPAYLGKSGTRTLFSIQTTSGKHIRAHSYFKIEDEILLPPGIYLQVIDSLNAGGDLHIIQLREIEPPPKMLADPFDMSSVIKDLLSIQKKEEGTNIASTLLVQSALKQKQPQTVEPTKSLYSDEELACQGRACAHCRSCRDWYWPRKLHGDKCYTKRPNASCTYRGYYRGIHGDYYWHCRTGRRPRNGGGDHSDYPSTLCECNDNQS